MNTITFANSTLSLNATNATGINVFVGSGGVTNTTTLTGAGDIKLNGTDSANRLNADAIVANAAFNIDNGITIGGTGAGRVNFGISGSFGGTVLTDTARVIFDIRGTIANTGTITTDNSAGGTITLDDANISNGTLAMTGLVNVTGNSSLDGVTLSGGELAVQNGATLGLLNTITFANSTLSLNATNATGVNVFVGTGATTATLTGTGDIKLNGTDAANRLNADAIVASAAFNIDNGITIGGTGAGRVNFGISGSFGGTVRTDAGAGTFNIDGTISNTGTITTDNSAGGTINLDDANISNGTLAMTGQLNVTGNSSLDGVTLSGGELAVQNGANLGLLNTITFANTTLSLNATNATGVDVFVGTGATTATLTGTGDIKLNGTDSANRLNADAIVANAAFNIDNGITIGGTGAGRVNFGTSGSFGGTVRTDAGAGNFDIRGTIANTGTITTDNSAGGTITLDDANISNGTLAMTGLVNVTGNSSLDGVTLSGGELAVLNGANLGLLNTITFANTTLSLNATNATGVDVFVGTGATTATLTGTGDIKLNGTDTANNFNADAIVANAAFNIDNGITIGGTGAGRVNFGTSGSFGGTVRTDAGAGNFNIQGTIANTGTITTDNSAGGTIALNNANISNGTLAMTGQLNVTGNSSLDGVTLSGGELAVLNGANLGLLNTITFAGATLSLNATDATGVDVGVGNGGVTDTTTLTGTGDIKLNSINANGSNRLDADLFVGNASFNIGNGITIGGNASGRVDFGTAGSFGGTVLTDVGAGNFDIQGTFSNTGTIITNNSAGGTITLDDANISNGTLAMTGFVNLTGNSSLDGVTLSGGELAVQNGANLGLLNTITFDNSTLSLNATNATGVDVGVGTGATTATLAGTGNIQLNSINANTNNRLDADLFVGGAAFDINNGITIDGNIGGRVDVGTAGNLGGTVDAQTGTTFTVRGTGAWTNTGGTIRNSGGTIALTGLAINTGTIDIDAGTITTNISLVNQGLITGDAGTLQLGGSSNLSLANVGTINPGDVGTAGTLNIAGDLINSPDGALSVDIGGVTAGTQYDQILVSGDFDAGNGALNVNLINGYNPATGQDFDIVSATTATGNFNTINAPAGFNGAIVGNVFRLTNSIVCQGICWDGGAGTTSWTDAANWLGDVLPTITDVVYIDLVNGVNVVYSDINAANTDIAALNTSDTNNLSITNGSITLNQTNTSSNFAGNLTLNGGDLIIADGTHNVNVSGEFAITSANSLLSGTSPNNIVTLSNAANASMAGGTLQNISLNLTGGDLFVTGNTTFSNVALTGGQVEIQGNGRVNLLNSFTFANGASINLNSTGAAATLTAGSAAAVGITGDGSIQLNSTTATLNVFDANQFFGGASFNIGNGVNITGVTGGNIDLGGGSFGGSLITTSNTAAFTLNNVSNTGQSMVLDTAAGGTIGFSNVTMNGGTLDINDAVAGSVDMTGAVALTNTTLDVQNRLDLTGTNTFDGVTLTSGQVDILSNGRLNLINTFTFANDTLININSSGAAATVNAGSSAAVNITGAGSIQMNGVASLNRFDANDFFGGASFNIANGVTVTGGAGGAIDLGGGSFDSSLITTGSSATFTLTGVNNSNQSLVLDTTAGGTIGFSNVTMSGGTLDINDAVAGSIDMTGNVALTNTTLDVQNRLDLTGTNTFDGVTLSNGEVFITDAARLNLINTFTMANDAVVSLNATASGTFLTAGSAAAVDINGAGSVQLNGSFPVNNRFDANDFFGGASFNIANGVTVTGDGGGQIDLGGGSFASSLTTGTNIADFTLLSVNNTGQTLILDTSAGGAIRFSNVTMNGGTLDVNDGVVGSIDMTGTTTLTNTTLDVQSRLDLTGTNTFDGVTLSHGEVAIEDTARLNLINSFTFANDTVISLNGNTGETFLTAGVSAGVDINGAGSIQMNGVGQQNQLDANRFFGGASFNIANGVIITGDAGGNVDLGGGSFDSSLVTGGSSASFGLTGVTNTAGETVVLDTTAGGTIGFSNLTMVGGTLDINDPVAASINMAGNVSLTNTTLDVQNQLSFTNTNTFGGVSLVSGDILIQPGGRLNLINSLTFANNASVTLNGSGAQSIVAAGSAAAVDINGTGSVQLIDTASQNFFDANRFFGGASFNIGSGVTVTGDAGGTVDLGGGNLAGTIEAQSGNLDISGLTNVGGTIRNSGATVSITGFANNAGTLDLDAGTTTTNTALNNTGTITGDAGTLRLGAAGDLTLTNDGTINPGETGTAGVINIEGNLTQGTSGTVSLDVFSPTVADQIVVSGNAALDGTLNLLVDAGYTPSIGDSLTAINAASIIGDFVTKNLGAFTVASVPGGNYQFFIPTTCAGTICFDNSAGNFLWNDAVNWNLDTLPTLTDTVFIDLAGTNTITLDSGTASVFSLNLLGDNSLFITGANVALNVLDTLTVNTTGSVTVDSGLTAANVNLISGSVLGAGTFTATDAWVRSAGTVFDMTGMASITQASGDLVIDQNITANGGVTLAATAGDVVISSDVSATQGDVNIAALAGQINQMGGLISASQLLANAQTAYNMSGGSIDVQNNSTMNTAFNWNGGTINTNGASLTLQQGGIFTNAQALNGTLINTGVLTLNNTALSGTGALQNDGTLNMSVQSDNTVDTAITGVGTTNLGNATLSINGGLTQNAMNISDGATVNINADTNVGDFSQTGGTLTGDANLNVGNSFNLNNDAMHSGNGKTILASGIDFNVTGRTIDRSFDVNGLTSFDSLLTINEGKVLNTIGGLSIDASDAAATLVGLGILRVPNDVTVQSAGNSKGLDNQGVLNVTGGSTFTLHSDSDTGVTNTHTGTFLVDSGATLNFASGNNAFADGAVLDGAGTFASGVTNTLTGTNQGLTIGSQATIDLNVMSFVGAGNLTNDGNIISNTAITLGGDFINQFGSTATLTNTTISGSLLNEGNFNINGTVTVSGNNIDQNDGTMFISNGSTIDMSASTAEFSWSGGTIAGTGTVGFSGGGVFKFDGDGDRVIDGLNFSFDNLTLPNGSLTLQSGSLTLTGTTFIPNGVDLIVTGGTFNSDGALRVNAGGNFVQDGGVFNNNVTLNIDGEDLGVLDDPTDDIAAGRFVYISGTIGGTGSLDNTGVLDLGAANVTNAITNNAGATINASGATFQQVFTNSGNLNLTGNNTFAGGIDLNAGGGLAGTGSANLNGNALSLNGTGDFNFDGLTINNVGAVTVASDQTLNATNATVNSTNALQSSGNVNLLGNNNFNGGFVQNTGTTTLGQSGGAQGNINTGSNAFTINSGELGGSGTINGDLVIGGSVISPGYSPGAITVNGDLILDNNSVLNIELAGTGAGLFDTIDVQGNVTLGGTLNVLSFGGFTASAGNNFDFLSFTGTRSGSFSSINLVSSNLQFSAGSNLLSVFVPSALTGGGLSIPGFFDPGKNVQIAFNPNLINIDVDQDDFGALVEELSDEDLRQCI